MINYSAYNWYLGMCIVSNFFLVICLWVVLFLLFIVLRLCKVIEKKAFKYANGVFGALLIGYAVVASVPMVIDIVSQSYMVQEYVVKIEQLPQERFRGDEYRVLVTSSNGQKDQYRSSGFDTEEYIGKRLNGYIVYAKYSDLILDYIAYDADT